MGVHVAGADAAAGEGRVRGLIAPRPPVLAPALDAVRLVLALGRREMRCHGCGYGAVVPASARPLPDVLRRRLAACPSRHRW